MILHVQLLRGIFRPQIFSYQLKHADEISGLWTKTTLLFFTTILLYATEVYFGIGTEGLINERAHLSNTEFESLKLLFGLGHILSGIVFTALILFLPALIFWVFLEIKFKKLLIIQQLFLAILLVEQAILIPLTIQLGLGQNSSPFSFGIISKMLSLNELAIHFFGVLSIFKIVATVFQYRLVRIMTHNNRKEALFVVLGVNVVFWVLNALLSYIQFEKLF